MNKLIDITSNTTYTENDALTNKSSLDKLTDFFFHGAALRNEQNISRILSLFWDAFIVNPTSALRILFHIRDVREGQGERRVFRIILHDLAHKQSDWVKENILLIPEYGRWDDLISIIYTPVQDTVIKIIKTQLLQDISAANRDEPCSLLAKWMPSENTSSKHTVQLAKFIRKQLSISSKSYREVLSFLREYIDIVENKLRTKQYDKIIYSNIPCKAGLRYRNTFLKKDKKRYIKYLNDVKENKRKINTGVLYPYDVLSKYQIHPNMHINVDQTIETMWNNLPDYVPNINGLVVADTSASMLGMPMFVSISLALYIAERNKNPIWKDHFISFSENPKFHKITGNTLKARAQSVLLGDIANTDLIAVFDLILNKATQNNILPIDMPQILIIVSDMEMDACMTGNTNFEYIKQKYSASGYSLPTIIFWNVSSRNTQCPVTINDNNVILLSGCSPVAFKYALGECTSSLSIVHNVINSKRYTKINY